MNYQWQMDAKFNAYCLTIRFFNHIKAKPIGDTLLVDHNLIKNYSHHSFHHFHELNSK